MNAPKSADSVSVHSSRRRQLGGASARSTLLTVLGEFVHPRGDAVWTASLIEALATLGVEEKAARQALSRTAAEGILEPVRHGRRARWHLTPAGKALLEEGTTRIYTFMRQQRPWDGRWLVLNVPIPETQRQLRHRLRTRMNWIGLGSPTPGLWITPDAGKQQEVRDVISDLGLDHQAFAWIGPASGIGDESKLLVDAWDLDAVEARYLTFLEEFEQRRADTAAAAFVAQVEMVEEWRRFPFLDPDLPGELLDHDWPGPRAAAAFHDRHTRWHRQAQSEWDRFDGLVGSQS